MRIILASDYGPPMIFMFPEGFAFKRSNKEGLNNFLEILDENGTTCTLLNTVYISAIIDPKADQYIQNVP